MKPLLILAFAGLAGFAQPVSAATILDEASAQSRKHVNPAFMERVYQRGCGYRSDGRWGCPPRARTTGQPKKKVKMEVGLQKAAASKFKTNDRIENGPVSGG